MELRGSLIIMALQEILRKCSLKQFRCLPSISNNFDASLMRVYLDLISWHRSKVVESKASTPYTGHTSGMYTASDSIVYLPRSEFRPLRSSGAQRAGATPVVQKGAQKNDGKCRCLGATMLDELIPRRSVKSSEPNHAMSGRSITHPDDPTLKMKLLEPASLIPTRIGNVGNHAPRQMDCAKPPHSG